jgi:hypothetical protein
VGLDADNVGRTHAPESMIVGSYANGMKLTSELLLDQLLTQYVSGCDHAWEALGPPLLDARLHPMGARRVDDQRRSRHTSTGRTEPAQGIQEADPLHGDVLAPGGVPHDHADGGVDDGQDGQFRQDT